MFNTAAFIFLIIAVFGTGFFIAFTAKNLVRTDSNNFFVRLAKFIAGKSGYVAAFGAGAILTVFFQIASSPYIYYRWTGLMEDITVGSIINDDETIMQTGQIPQDVLDWYAKMKETGQI